MYEAQDKVVLVTGGAAGIGACVVKAFLEEGAKHVAALDININQGKLLEKELSLKYDRKIQFHECDITTNQLEAAYDDVIREFGQIDVVINCAGIMNDSPEAFVKEIEVNVTALIRSSMKAFHHMRKDYGGRGGSILNVASLVALMHLPLMPIYSATKSAVFQFSTSLGMEPRHSSSGVRVVTLCFGLTDTNMVRVTKGTAIDKETNADLDAFVKGASKQSIDSAVAGLMEAFKKGPSASTWVVTSGKPAQDITANVSKGFDIMGQSFVDAE